MPSYWQLGESNQLHKDSFVLLNDGHRMPVLGIGSFSPSIIPEEGGFQSNLIAEYKEGNLVDEELTTMVKENTKTAIDIGYRHVDGAYLYMTEEAIGQAFREKFANGSVKRDDLFYTSKLWNTFHQPPLVRTALQMSLKSLKLDYVDLYIIHMPMSLKPGEEFFPVDEHGNCMTDEVDLLKTWEALEKCKDAGLTKSIGVSNFNRNQIKMILNKPGLKHKPVCNQVECHPYLNQSELLDFCKSEDIVLVAYGVLGSPGARRWVHPSCVNLLEDTVLTSIGEKYKKSCAQVSIRYMIQRGCVALVKSFNPDRLKENLEVFDFELDPDEMKAIDDLNRNLRYWKFTWMEKHHNYPFHCPY